MTEKEIRTLRDKIGTDPILTDEEIEYIWMVMDKQESMKPERIMKTMSMCLTKEECGPAYTCDCGAYVGYLHEYCNDCGQKLDWED